MIEYSVGFLHDDNRIVLIRKNRPEWQAGLLNGVGGHIEPGESPYECMCREFQEETGVLFTAWDKFATLVGDKAKIHVFAGNDNGGFIDRVKTTTDEEIVVTNLLNVDFYGVPNLKWLIPLARQRGKYKPITVNFLGDS